MEIEAPAARLTAALLSLALIQLSFGPKAWAQFISRVGAVAVPVDGAAAGAAGAGGSANSASIALPSAAPLTAAPLAAPSAFLSAPSVVPPLTAPALGAPGPVAAASAPGAAGVPDSPKATSVFETGKFPGYTVRPVGFEPKSNDWINDFAASLMQDARLKGIFDGAAPRAVGETNAVRSPRARPNDAPPANDPTTVFLRTQISRLDNDDETVRMTAYKILARESPLPQFAVELLIENLEGAAVYYAEDLLLRQSTLSDASVERLAFASQSKDATARHAATHVLQNAAQKPAAARALAARLQDADGAVRALAYSGLKELTDLPQSVVELVIAELGGGNEYYAANVLARQRALSDASVKLLVLASQSKNKDVRLEATAVLQATPHLTAAIALALVARLGDADDRVRSQAYDGLKKYKNLPQSVVELLIEKLGEPPAYAAAEILVQQSALSEASVERLIAASRSENPTVRRQATNVLQAVPLTLVIAKALAARLGDADQSVREYAYEGLKDYKGLPESVVQLLIDQLGKTSDIYAAKILARQTDLSDANRERLLAALGSENAFKRAQAAAVLAGAPKTSKTLEALAVGLNDPDPAVRSNSYAGLSQSKNLSESVIRVLIGYIDAQAKNQDGKTAWDYAAAVLKAQKSLPDFVFDVALATLKKNPAKSNADVLFIDNAKVPAGVVAELLSLLRAATSDAVKFKLTLTLESRVKAGPLLASLYPDRIEELRGLLPGLDQMPASSLSQSAFRNRSQFDAILDYLKQAKNSLSGEEYGALIAGYKTLAAIAPKILLTPAEPGFKSAAGYRLPYAVPGVPGSLDARPPVYAEIKGMQPSPEKRQALIASYDAFDALIDANFKALSIMAKNSGAFTRGAAEDMLRQTDRMAEAYVRIDGDPKNILAYYKKLRSELEGLWKTMPKDARLPREIAQRITEFEPGASSIRNLHTMVNFLHQAAFAALSRKTKALQADAVLKTPYNNIPFVDLGEAPLFSGFQVLNPLFGMIGVKGAPNNSHVIFKNDELSYHASLGVHSVEIHVKLAEPDEGGLLLIRYSEGGGSSGNKNRRAYLASALERMGVPAQKEGAGFLNVSWDKDHGLASKAQLAEIFPRVLKLFGNTLNMDLRLRDYPEKAALSLAEVFAAEGALPFDAGNQPVRDLNSYTDNALIREKLRAALDAELERLGLAPLPADRPFGQQVIEDFFSAPVREALMRGELVKDADGPPRRAAYAPLETLASQVKADAPRALSVAGVLRAAESEAPLFATIGGVGRLRAERAQWIWGSEGVVVHVLRDPRTSAIAYGEARRFSDGKLTSLGADELAATLRKHGLDVPPGVDAGAAQQKSWERLLRSAPSNVVRRAASGLPASPGRGAALGRAVFRTEGAFEPGGVFIAPYTTPDDLERMRKSAAVVTTGGGLLSHAAITTRELGLPAVILPAARWGQDDKGRPVLELALEKTGTIVPGPNEFVLTRGGGRETSIVREGDLVRVDGRRGIVASYSAEAGKAILTAREALARLAASTTKPAAFVAWLQSLAPATQAEVGRFILDETLPQDSLPALQSRLFSILARNVDKSAGLALRREAGARILDETASVFLEESDGDEAEALALKGRVGSLRRLAAAFQIQSPELAALDSGVTALIDKTHEKARLEREVWLARADALVARAGQLTAEDLPEMRRVLRHVLPGRARGDKQLASTEAVKTLQKKEAALAKAKKNLLLSARPTVIPLGALDDDYVPLVGGKSAKLGEIISAVRAAGGYVPDGVALTTEAYLRFLRESGLEAQVLSAASGLDALLAKSGLDSPQGAQAIETYSARIQKLLRSAKLNPESGLGREILTSLQAHGLDGAAFAVRSSAVQEDSDEAAFAGAAETHLYVQPKEVLDKIVETWASFWLPRGIQYRWQQGIRSIELRPAVTIQRMAQAESAGVMFTMDPASGKRNIVINAAFGLGEGVVSGLVQADQYTADRTGAEISLPVLGDKKVQVVPQEGGRGTEVRAVPLKLRKQRALTPRQLKALALIGAALEEHFGFPLDIEFAVEKNHIAIVQARPITVKR